MMTVDLLPEGAVAAWDDAPLSALVGCWDLRLGYHPTLASHLPMLGSLPVFPSAEEWASFRHLQLPVAPLGHGHHIVRDAGYVAASIPAGGMAEVVDEYPLAPAFVRDLCGRIIHTGFLPLPAAPSIPVFPSACRHVSSESALLEIIEHALFLTYRRIECAAPVAEGPVMAGQSELALRAVSSTPQAIPYKLRPDTFYADGWRVPQVARVYAVPVTPLQAQSAADELLQRWRAKPAGQEYEAFYDANEGESWFEDLFQRGCTVIPTLEAYNGRYHVDADYVATAVDPGRAVPGLHEIVRREASDLPEGTILTVEEPGWVTSTLIQPARVSVSDGSGFVAAEAPLPALPNLALPHMRIGGAWGAVWLPSHPEHFAEPALYDWDATGHFVQINGPLWDPLHYTYTCTSQLIRAVRKPLEGHPGLYVLPETLKMRFHPVMGLASYDAYNERTAQQRLQDPAHPLYGCGIDAVPLMRPVAGVGYHPLPWALEYELDPAHMPELNPRHRVSPCPPPLLERLAPIAELYGLPAEYLRYNVVVSEPQRITLASALEAQGSDLSCGANGTLLPQQLQQRNPEGQWAVPAWLPDMPPSHLAVNVKRLFAARTYRQALQKAAHMVSQPQLPAAFYQFREAALAWRRLRYRLFTKYPATWQQACVEGLNLMTAEPLIPNHLAEQHAAVRDMRASLLGVVLSVPAERAVDLPSSSTRASLERGKPKGGRQGNGRGRKSSSNTPTGMN